MVSIIITYIDELDYLTEALTSAASQRIADKEIIVVCNASVLPGKFLSELKGTGDVIFIHQPTTGSAHARNAGLNAAQGEWIQFLDVDDLLLPDKISHQLAHAEADVVVSPHTFLHLNGKKENSKWLPEDVWCGLLNSGLGSTSSMLWKRQALLDVKGWNTEYRSHQEYELLFRIMAAGKTMLTDDHCETIVRQRKYGSITTTTKPVRVMEGIRLRENMWDHLVKQKLDTPERFEAFRQYIFRQLRGLFRQNREEAMLINKKYFSDIPFMPKEIHVPGYAQLYRTLGFYRTERMIEHFVSIRNILSIQNKK